MKDLDFFKYKYKNDTERYWAISEYLTQIFNKEIVDDKKIRDELISFIEIYTAKIIRNHYSIE